MNIVVRMAACRNIALGIVLVPAWMASMACMGDTAHIQQAGRPMSEQEMSIVSGGWGACHYYEYSHWCGIDLKCTDAVGGLCIPIIADCRDKAYSGEWAWGACHYMGAGGLYELGDYRDCGWQFECWCDVGITGIGTCKKKNGTNDQSYFHLCGDEC